MNTPALIKVPDFQRSFVDTREHRRVIRRPTETWHRFLYILRRRHTHTITYRHMFPEHETDKSTKTLL